MVDHRKTPSRRAYHLPGWFFGLAAVLCVLGVVAVGWSVTGDRSASPEPVPAPTSTSTTPAPTQTISEPAEDQPTSAERPAVAVEILNATSTAGLAARTADDARDAGWTVTRTGNWLYGASHNAVYYPEGSEDAAGQLARDLGIESVEPATEAMADDKLTVLVIDRP
jgi:hypothetical protein